MGYKEVFKRNALDSSFTLSKNMVVNGDIKGDVSGRIEGHIFGNVCVQGKVVIADSGIIEGDISGSDVVVQGLVKAPKGKLTETIFCGGTSTTPFTAITSSISL